MSRCAALLPGARYPTSAPLLWFARAAAKARGWEVIEQRDLLGDREHDPFSWALERAQQTLDEASGADTIAVIGKSLGSAAAGLVADRELAAVWLTPLLIDPRVCDGLARASGPALLIGSSADETWDASKIPDNDAIEVLELHDLDHALELPGDPLASLDALRTVTARVGEFLQRL